MESLRLRWCHGLLALRHADSSFDMLLLRWVDDWLVAALPIVFDDTLVEHVLNMLCLLFEHFVLSLHLLHGMLHLLHLEQLLLELLLLALGTVLVLQHLSFGPSTFGAGLHQVAADSVGDYSYNISKKSEVYLPDI